MSEQHRDSETIESPNPQEIPDKTATLSRRIAAELQVENDIRPILVGASNPGFSGAAFADERYIVRGTITVPKPGSRGYPRKQVIGVYEPPGMVCLSLDLSRGGIGEILKLCAPGTGQIELIDSKGECYTPIGYLHLDEKEYTVRINPDDAFQTLDTLPLEGIGEGHRLRVYFYVPNETVITELRLGDFTLGECRLLASQQMR